MAWYWIVLMTLGGVAVASWLTAILLLMFALYKGSGY